MTHLAEQNGATVYHCDWRALLSGASCDTLIVDAPYSERVHAGHDAQVEHLESNRRTLDYGHWTTRDVGDFVAAWSPRTRGWFVSITDHVLAVAWADALTHAGRYVFAPLPFVAPGSRVRLAGDGRNLLDFGEPWQEKSAVPVAGWSTKCKLRLTIARSLCFIERASGKAQGAGRARQQLAADRAVLAVVPVRRTVRPAASSA